MTVTVAIPCAVAGIVVGVVDDTGIGLKFSGLIVNLSSGMILPALVMTLIGCIIMGMGMPTAAAYIMAATLLGPALAKLGIPVLAAHMFIYYFAILSMLTPPVALSAYVASGVAGSDLTKTGWKAFQLSLAGFLIPFAFVYNPSMLFIGPLGDTVWITFTSIVGVAALAASITGHLSADLMGWERVALLVCSLAMIVPEKITDFAGIGALILIVWVHVIRARKNALITASAEQV